jgi:hypothetical protein
MHRRFGHLKRHRNAAFWANNQWHHHERARLGRRERVVNRLRATGSFSHPKTLLLSARFVLLITFLFWSLGEPAKLQFAFAACFSGLNRRFFIKLALANQQC